MCCASRRRLLLQLGCWACTASANAAKGVSLANWCSKTPIDNTSEGWTGYGLADCLSISRFLPAEQLELRRPTNSTEASARVYQAAEGIGRCKYAVRAAHLALAEVKTLASTGKHGASFLPTAVLLRVVESSRHLLFLVRSAAERNRKFYALRAGHSHTRSPARYAVDRR